MRTPHSCALVPLLLSLLSLKLSVHAQASMCAPAGNNPLVVANHCSPAPPTPHAIEDTNPVDSVQSLLTLTVEQINHVVLDSAPLIHAGDFMLFETNRRDFVLHLFLSNGKEIVTQPLTREDADDTSVAWRKGRIRLDYPVALNQRIVGLRLVPLHAVSAPLLIRGIKIDGNGKLIFALEKSNSGPAKPQLVEPPMSYPPDPHVMTASASRPDIWGRKPNTGYLAPRLPSYVIHPVMFQSTTTTSTGDPNHYKYNGKELDPETGLYYYGARYYSPALGRFTTPDPKMISKQRMLDPQQWNMYSYARNNPTSMFDPDGKEAYYAVQGNNITVQINVLLTGNAAPRDATSFQQSANRTLGGQHQALVNGEKYNVNIKVNASTDPKNLPNPQTHGQNTLKIDNNAFKTEVNNDGKTGTGKTGDLQQGNVPGHESLHFAGLPDEYLPGPINTVVNGATGESYNYQSGFVIPGTEDNVMANPENPNSQLTQQNVNDLANKALQLTQPLPDKKKEPQQ